MNTKTFIDIVNKPLVTYSFLQGTRYSLNRCGLAVAATGVFAGLSAYALTNKSMKKYVVPSAVVLGSGAMMLLLAKNNYSLKPKIATRGINYAQGAIAKQISHDHHKKSNLCEAASRYLALADKQQYTSTTINNGLSQTIQKHWDAGLISSTNSHYPIISFKQYNFPLFNYIDSKIIETKKIRAEIIEGKNQQQLKDLEIYKLQLDNYNEALLHINVFIYKDNNSKSAHCVLLNNLRDILSNTEIEDIDDILLNSYFTDTRENKTTGKVSLVEYKRSNLINQAGNYMQQSREIRKNIELMKVKYNLKVNSYGVTKFLNLDKLIDCMPK